MPLAIADKRMNLSTVDRGLEARWRFFEGLSVVVGPPFWTGYASMIRKRLGLTSYPATVPQDAFSSLLP